MTTPNDSGAGGRGGGDRAGGTGRSDRGEGPGQAGGALSMLHVSDLHFGRPAVPAVVDAIEELIRQHRYDVVAVSGDLSQRSRAGEFQRAHAFLRDAARVSHVVVVPGNHDVAWWRSPLHLVGAATIYGAYRRYISDDLEPVLRVRGATIVGLNTAHGVSVGTLTRNPRDISIIGDVRPRQLERVRAEFAASPERDARIIIMHHNPVRGALSRRFGLKAPARLLDALSQMGVDLVLCGHDHQESIDLIERTEKGMVISTAGTVSNRSRGGRPSSVNEIRLAPSSIEVRTLVWSSGDGAFAPGPARCFPR